MKERVRMASWMCPRCGYVHDHFPDVERATYEADRARALRRWHYCPDMHIPDLISDLPGRPIMVFSEDALPEGDRVLFEWVPADGT